MEAEIGENPRHFYVPNLRAVEKKNLEWDLNNWRWDGDLFTATDLNSRTTDYSRQFFPIESGIPTQTGQSNSNSSGSEDRNWVEIDRGKRELEKRRRDVEHEEEEEEELTEEARSLKLGKQVYPITQIDVNKLDIKNGKKTKVVVGPSSNRTLCQVDDCQADLTGAKDYHRRHKVCDVHSKATGALVGNVMQRFCQQCSRFHAIQEFDEGKRSCRRRLAGHNKRRRKTNPESVVTNTPANVEQNSNYLLITLLKLLSNLHPNNASDNAKDQNLLGQLLKSLASVPTEDAAVCGNSSAPSSALDPVRILGNDNREETVRISSPSCSTLVVPSKESNCVKENGFSSNGGRSNVNNFDLNNVYEDSEDCSEGVVLVSDTHVPKSLEEASLGCSSWVYQDPLKSSPPNISGNSASPSTLSPSSSSGEAQVLYPSSSSSGEAQSRTDRIVFKLFGKDPVDLPCGLRKQILDWLSHTPTDIESHIRPGCVILSIYLRMDEAMWDQLFYDLSSGLQNLLSSSTESFWRTGWICTRVRHRVAFVFDGQIILDTPLPRASSSSCLVMNVKPIAVCASDTVKFTVKGFNLSRGTSRLLCAIEGKYLANECCADIVDESEPFIEAMDIQTLTFDCVIPKVTGRGFIEIEDQGLNSSFFPFIVAESDVCYEIRTLDSIIEADESSGTPNTGRHEGLKILENRNQALDFLHEFGWLLHRCQSKLRLGQADPNPYLFSFKRFRWLVLFSMDHDWCAVVQKLLNILFENIIDLGESGSPSDALMDIELLHRAVRRNSRSMVEVLLRYQINGALREKSINKDGYLFRPDMVGPGGLTPIHIAAGIDGSEQVLDALTDDPGLVGIEAWKSAHDSTGLTPCDYASLRGHYSYIHLVQRKIKKKISSTDGQHVVEIPGGSDTKHVKMGGLWTEKAGAGTGAGQCRRCEIKTDYGKKRSLGIYRPAMLSMVAIAAVCVCVALLFKSSPMVDYMDSPFCWEMLDFGSI